jgi:hypothetical protein
MHLTNQRKMAAELQISLHLFQTQFSQIKNSAKSVVDDALHEPIRRQLGIANRVLDVAMTEVGLQGSGIMTLVGQRKAAGVPQHVRVSSESPLLKLRTKFWPMGGLSAAGPKASAIQRRLQSKPAPAWSLNSSASRT